MSAIVLFKIPRWLPMLTRQKIRKDFLCPCTGKFNSRICLGTDGCGTLTYPDKFLPCFEWKEKRGGVYRFPVNQ
ncbi:MAG TPA: hypothetical protein DDW76_21635 [Cyanobacteria bacterium UBA11369]|nr:hypothetical protein [Cyanobacteria bacterium UBA11368]HBE51303.1 hypothetical protein [Cyanobacteria bacterium UBA11369]